MRFAARKAQNLITTTTLSRWMSDGYANHIIDSTIGKSDDNQHYRTQGTDMADRLTRYWGLMITLAFCLVCGVHILNFLGL